MRCALTETVEKIISAVKITLENTPPELSADIAARGIVLTGGGANICGLSQLITERTGIPAAVAENPETCVAKGTGNSLAAFLYRRSFPARHSSFISPTRRRANA